MGKLLPTRCLLARPAPHGPRDLDPYLYYASMARNTEDQGTGDTGAMFGVTLDVIARMSRATQRKIANPRGKTPAAESRTTM